MEAVIRESFRRKRKYLTNIPKEGACNYINMFIRNYKGTLIEFNWREYGSEKEMYIALWKIMYNIELKDAASTNTEILNYIEE